MDPSKPDLSTTIFYHPGEYVSDDPNQVMSGALYVELWRAGVTQPYPIVMLHGGGQTGTCYTAKPDGSEGWAQYFARSGFAVYVVDEPARGRSPYNHSVDGPIGSVVSAELVERLFTATSRFGLWPAASRHTQWVGKGVRNDPVFDRFYASQVPQLADDGKMQALAQRALSSFISRIGPAILLTHSQGGPRGWLVADAVPELIKGILAVEPAGGPFFMEPFLADLIGLPHDTIAHPYGITTAPITYDPPVGNPRHLLNWDTERAKGRGWKLPNLSGVPIGIVTAEASYHHESDQRVSEFLSAMGVRHELIMLENLGIHGNGHMMMLERNSDEIAEVLVGMVTNWGLASTQAFEAR